MKWIAFLRGINVGGHRKLPMADLRRIVAKQGSAETVQTYIASGNVMFVANGEREAIVGALSDAILEEFGFEVPVLVFSEKEIRAVLTDCPFPRGAGKTVHAFFCFDTPRLDHGKIEALRAPNEELVVIDKTIWLFAPDGIGKSKLAAGLNPGVEMTARNLNTVEKMVDMLEAQA